ncbi:oxidoreductase [Erythrobacter sp. KY5]|uniref:proton-conducting transporter transmembrane domain-containing protein n=1 Tax=Erythrobacter sp. KY5 TaxID=2011159 RepID=UPI000DBF000C|nr:proton-conducting transporter membrane subunit [Erythrobacter sp. KY5]AWW75770.1 oxidoreductase [Erythrobacter sp. KY5]
MIHTFLPLAAPLLFAIVALVAWASPRRRPKALLQFAEMAALGTIAISLASIVQLVVAGPSTSALIGAGGFGISARLDAVSVTMLAMICSIGWVLLRYSANYLDGEERQGVFIGWMAATLCAVLLFVLAGNLVQLTVAFIAISLTLQRLLLFYPDRIQAVRGARKRFIVARLGDAALIGAVFALWQGYATTDIATILGEASMGSATTATLVAASLLALAAILKSVQFPTHGWLTEVVDTPTPVSALLHAGVVNGGGVLLIRFADVMLLAPNVLAVLVLIGGFSALLGSLAMLGQPAVKNSLAWSTIAQMGFMIMQCGLALFPLALLHIVAHSYYKAHAFLSSGSAVENVAAIRKPGPIAVPSMRNVMTAFALALGIYAAIGALFGISDKSPQAIALGAILVFGVAYLFAQGLADKAPRELTRKTVIYSLAASLGYFTLQRASEWLTAGTLPATPAPGPLEWALIVLAVASFGVVAIAQALFPLWALHPAASGLRVHLSNGLYANAVFDRLVGNWSTRKAR